MGLGRLRIVSKKVSNTLFSLVNKGYCPFQVDATNAQSTSTNYTRVAPLASLHNASPQCLNQTTSSSSTFNSSQDSLSVLYKDPVDRMSFDDENNYSELKSFDSAEEPINFQQDNKLHVLPSLPSPDILPPFSIYIRNAISTALDWDSNRCKDSVSQTNPSVVDQITI
ncbi:unnamed protein product, partial [Rotaria sordida]